MPTQRTVASTSGASAAQVAARRSAGSFGSHRRPALRDDHRWTGPEFQFASGSRPQFPGMRLQPAQRVVDVFQRGWISRHPPGGNPAPRRPSRCLGERPHRVCRIRSARPCTSSRHANRGWPETDPHRRAGSAGSIRGRSPWRINLDVLGGAYERVCRSLSWLLIPVYSYAELSTPILTGDGVVRNAPKDSAKTRPATLPPKHGLLSVRTIVHQIFI